jgi:carbon storage regulator CsrA
MLILSRRTQESVVIGEPGGLEEIIRITVLQVSNGKVKLGFEVDTRIPVHRAEVWEKLLSEQLDRDVAAAAARGLGET